MNEQLQRLFHINRLPTKKELFEFIALMRRSDNTKTRTPSSRKRDKHRSLLNEHKDLEEIVLSGCHGRLGE